jgi:hypothetical protein
MKTDTEIKSQAFEILYQKLGSLETEKFIALIKRDNFDYTEWRRNLPHFADVTELSAKAMEARNREREKFS